MYERSYFFLFFPRRCTVVELLISREKEPSKFVEPMLYVFLIYGIISISRAVTFLIRRDALRSFSHTTSSRETRGTNRTIFRHIFPG